MVRHTCRAVSAPDGGHEEAWTVLTAFDAGMGRLPVPDNHPQAYGVPWEAEGCVRLVGACAPPAEVRDPRVREAVRYSSLLPLRAELPGWGSLEGRLGQLDLGLGLGVFPGGPNVPRETWENFTPVVAEVLGRWSEFLYDDGDFYFGSSYSDFDSYDRY